MIEKCKECKGTGFLTEDCRSLGTTMITRIKSPCYFCKNGKVEVKIVNKTREEMEKIRTNFLFQKPFSFREA